MISKCRLCTETLTHIVKKAEVETGAGTATVTRAIAEKINENAAPGDKVTAGALEQRVRRHEGANDKATNRNLSASHQNSEENSGDTGDITTEKVVQRVETIVEQKGVSERKAAEIVAEETGKNPDSIRRTVSRQKAKAKSQGCVCPDEEPEELVPMSNSDIYQSVSELMKKGSSYQDACADIAVLCCKTTEEVKASTAPHSDLLDNTALVCTCPWEWLEGTLQWSAFRFCL